MVDRCRHGIAPSGIPMGNVTMFDHGSAWYSLQRHTQEKYNHGGPWSA